jgi:hypothetical protein
MEERMTEMTRNDNNCTVFPFGMTLQGWMKEMLSEKDNKVICRICEVHCAQGSTEVAVSTTQAANLPPVSMANNGNNIRLLRP